MTKKVYCVNLPEDREEALHALRMIRGYFAPMASFADAAGLYNIFAEEGYVFVGETDAGEADAIVSIVHQKVAEIRLEARESAPPSEAHAVEVGIDDELPPDVWATAMVLVSMSDGNPVMAVGYCRALAHSTGQVQYWAQVFSALIRSFHWLAGILVANET